MLFTENIDKISGENWKREGLDTLQKKTDETGSTDQRHASGGLSY